MSAVPKSIYFGADHATRRRVKKELERIKLQQAARLDVARELSAQQPGSSLQRGRFDEMSPAEKDREKIIERILVANRDEQLMPVHLRACHACGKLPSDCTCLDWQGLPLRASSRAVA